MASRNVPQNVEELEEVLSRPTPAAIDAMRRIEGDVAFLGIGGKMGPTMARMAQRASQESGVQRRIYGVSRFSTPEIRARLESWGIQTIPCDLLDDSAVAKLPDVPNVVSMVGFKFGARDAPARTWAINCYLPSLVARKFRRSRIVAFSTGNVYPLTPVDTEGPTESTAPAPLGEYAMTALGRERIFQYFCEELEIPTALLRLNYATELRYGVLVDLAEQVQTGAPIDVSMSYVNVIWLADANAMGLAALRHCEVPARIFNLSGPKLRVRDLAEGLGRHLQKIPRFTGDEGPTALLNDGRGAYELLGAPQTDADQMLRWTADWLARGGERSGKPTHFQVRDGKF